MGMQGGSWDVGSVVSEVFDDDDDDDDDDDQEWVPVLQSAVRLSSLCKKWCLQLKLR